MSEELKSSVVFEFSTKNAEKANKELEQLIDKQNKLKDSVRNNAISYNESEKALDSLIKKRKEYETIIDSSKGGEKERKALEDIRKQMDYQSASIVKLNSERVKLVSAQKEINKNAEKEKESLKNISKSYTELAKASKNGTASINDLKKAQSELTKELSKENIGTDRYKSLSKNLGELKTNIKQVTDEQKKYTKQSDIQNNSIAEARIKVSDLKKEVVSLSKTDPKFKEKAKELSVLTDELKASEASIGVFSRNVGNYEGAINGLSGSIGKSIPGFGLLAGGIGKVSTAMKALLLNPVGLFFGAIAVAVLAVKSAFESSEEGSDKLNKIMGGLNATLGVLKDSFSDIGEALIEVFQSPEKIFDLMIGYFKTIFNLAEAFRFSILGIFSDEAAEKAKEYFDLALPSVNKIVEASAKGAELAEQENKLRKEKREFLLEEAKIRNEVALLQEKSLQKDKFSDEERLKALNKANDLLKDISGKEVRLAEETLRIEQERAKLSKNTAEDNQKLVELEAETINIQNKSLAERKRFESQISALKLQSQKDEEKAIQDANNAYLKSFKERKDAEIELKKIKESGSDKEIEIAQRILNIKEEEFKKYSNNRIDLTEEESIKLEQIELDHQKKLFDLEEKRLDKEESLRIKDIERKEKEQEEEIKRYVKNKLEIQKLENSFQESRNVEERQYIKERLEDLTEEVGNQVKVLDEMGVEASKIPVQFSKSFEDSNKSVAKSLEKSLKTMKQFTSASTGAFGEFSISTTALLSTAFDLSQLKEKWGDDVEGMKREAAELKAELISLSASTALSGIQGVSGLIQQQLGEEIKGINQLYKEEDEARKENFKRKEEELKESLRNNGISEARYNLEKAKEEEKLRKESIKAEKTKAKEVYEIQSKQFKIKKATDIASALTGSSLAAVQALAQGGPFLGPFLAAMVTGLAAIQISLIKKQKGPDKPKFKTGGLIEKGKGHGIVDGKTHGQGGEPVIIGNEEVAEVEDGEGILVISKRDMNNSFVRTLYNRVVKNKKEKKQKFATGGVISFNEYRESAEKNFINHYKKQMGEERAREILYHPDNKDYYDNAFLEMYLELLNRKENRAELLFNSAISSNDELVKRGITSVGKLKEKESELTSNLNDVDARIKAEKDLQDAKIQSLKIELDYDEKVKGFNQSKKEAQEELNAATLQFNKDTLKELRETGAISVEEYNKYLDEIVNGYGIKTSEIINLKKKEIEEQKKLINEARQEELTDAQEKIKFQQQALEEFRSNFKKEYDSITKSISEGLELTSEEISKLSETDLERYEQIKKITEDTKKLNEDLLENQEALNNGDAVLSRKERQELLEEQKRIKEELAEKEREAEEERKKLEEERKENQQAALSAFESENKEEILAILEEQGEQLQEQAGLWTLDKELAEQLEAQLSQINGVYDEQIAQQDAIIDDLNEQLDIIQKTHDKKIANIKAEEQALKDSFEKQKTFIENEFSESTKKLQKEAANLNTILATIKQASIQAGLQQYQSSINDISDALNNIPEFENGGVFEFKGNSHKEGGINLFAGNKAIANVEGGEYGAIVSKKAAKDPEAIRALGIIDSVNKRHSSQNISYNNQTTNSTISIDYGLLSKSIAKEMHNVSISNSVNLSIDDVERANKINSFNKNKRMML